MSDNVFSGRTYRDAADALNAILVSPAASDEEVAKAKQAAEALHKAWRDGVAAEFAARTAQYNQLVARLQAVTGSIVSNPLQPLRARLNRSIDQARQALAAAAAEAFARRPAPVVTAEAGMAEAVASGHAFGKGDSATLPEADDGEPPAPPVPAPLPGVDVAAAAAASPMAAALYREYAALFETCLIQPQRAELIAKACGRVRDGKARYDVVAAATGVPWWIIGLIHGLECGYDFDRHLHNGDPLSARTVRVPRGRPAAGQPRFSWEDSARDALDHDKLVGWGDWSIPAALYKLERYNGWGYRKHHPDVLTPYLWSFTNHYAKGKYVADGRFDPEAVSKQVGAAAILRQLANDGLLA